MANKLLPPLQVPIPRSSPCHYSNDTDYIASIDPWLLSPLRRIMWDLRQRKDFAPEYDQADAFYRVFAKRSVDKKKKYRPKILYVLFDHTHEFISVVRTFKEAKKLLSKDSVYTKKFGRTQRVSLRQGAYLLKTIDGRVPISFRHMDVEYDRVPKLIATKKCGDCPNKNSDVGLCHCAFWSRIRDGRSSWQFWSPHEIRTKRRQKKQDLKLDVRIVLH